MWINPNEFQSSTVSKYTSNCVFNSKVCFENMWSLKAHRIYSNKSKCFAKKRTVMLNYLTIFAAKQSRMASVHFFRTFEIVLTHCHVLPLNVFPLRTTRVEVIPGAFQALFFGTRIALRFSVSLLEGRVLLLSIITLYNVVYTRPVWFILLFMQFPTIVSF